MNDALFKEMINFYETWYSANIMTLSVIGKGLHPLDDWFCLSFNSICFFAESLDELEKFVVPLFGQIVNKNVKQFWVDRHPYPYDVCRKMAKIIPFRETRKLIMFFPLPDIQYDASKRDVSP